MTAPVPVRRRALFLALAALVVGGLLFGVFATMVLRSRAELVDELHRRIVEREAAVLRPFALQQVDADSESDRPPLTALLRGARQEGMLAVAVFDAAGATVDTVPADQLFVELAINDYVRLQSAGSLSRYHPAFPLDEYFAGVAPARARVPVLEVLLAVPPRHPGPPIGFVRYFLDGRPLGHELAAIDTRLRRQTFNTLAGGAAIVALVMAAAAYGLHRAQRAISVRNERLARANFELTLAAKASALGQITSHLIHGLQGSVAGLRAAVATPGEADWQSASDYTQRLQTMIGEAVGFLRDIDANAAYDLDAQALGDALRERHRATAAQRGVVFTVSCQFPGTLDNHRGGILCLIAANLVENAIAATPAGRQVRVSLAPAPGALVLDVADEGPGVPPERRAQLFVPGRSGRPGGSGLGLAISQLLARQIGAELSLAETGPDGSVFRLVTPRDGAAPASGIASAGNDRR